MRRSRSRFTNLIAAVTAASAGLVTLGGLFAKTGFPAVVAAVLLQIGVVVMAIALMIGFLNLMLVHLRRLRRVRQGGVYSLVLILSAGAVIVIRLLDVRTNDGSEQEVSAALFKSILISGESALAGLLFFFLVFAAYRMLRRQITWNGCLFIAALLLILVGFVPLKGLELFSGLRDWTMEVPVTAGSRGMLIGVGLATVTAGLRVLIGQERAYREE